MFFIRRLLAVLASCLAIACSGSTTPGVASTGTPPDAGATSPLPDAGPAGGTDAGNGPSGEADAGTGGDGSGGDVADAGSGGSGSADAGTAGGGDAGGGGGGTPDAGTGGGASTAPEQLTSGANAVALAIDANNVYFLDRTGTTDAVRSVPKSGGATATLSSGTPGHRAKSLIATGDAVLWEAVDGSDWAIFESDGGSVHRVAPLLGGSGLAASATTAFTRDFDVETGRWDLLGCARDGSGCKAIVTDSPLVEPVYFDSGKLYFLQQPTDTDFGIESTLESYDPSADPFHTFGFMILQNAQGISGLRVNGSIFGLRSHGNVWTGRLGSTFAMIRAAPNGDDVDISHGRVYWNQSSCLGSANIDGTGLTCLDEGDHDYAGVRVDETAVYFIRDGDIFRIAK